MKPNRIIDLIGSSQQIIYSAGLELIYGIEYRSAELETEPALYLTERSEICDPPLKEASVPSDLYLKFAKLGQDFARGAPVEMDILKFANEFGCLAYSTGDHHFHRSEDLAPAAGEPLSYWHQQLQAFGNVFSLHEAVEKAEKSPRGGSPWTATARSAVSLSDPVRSLQRMLAGFGAPLFLPAEVLSRHHQGVIDDEDGKEEVYTGLEQLNTSALSFPKFLPARRQKIENADDVLHYAKLTIDQTINKHFNEERASTACGRPGCTPWEHGLRTTDRIAAQLQGGKLVFAAGTLGRNLWLQLASYVSGLRLVKECLSCGLPMDVTKNKRPEAVLKHEACVEKDRKRKWRRTLGHASTRASKTGKTPGESN